MHELVTGTKQRLVIIPGEQQLWRRKLVSDTGKDSQVIQMWLTRGG